MICQENYITVNRDSTSRSGLYASDLPGFEDALLPLLSKNSESNTEVWERIYGNAWTNMVSDVLFGLQEKFFVNHKLVSRETSEFTQEVNLSGDLSGIRLQFDLPRYAVIHILSIELKAQEDYTSPETVIYFYKDNAEGELIDEISQPIEEGKNTIFVDRDFEVDALFIAYDANQMALNGTENKSFNTGFTFWNKFECLWPCFGGQGSVKQINGGGLNVVYNITCSAEKFVCQNLNLFRKAFWWKIGEEAIVERRIGNRLNQFTTMTDERKTELANFYNSQYTQALGNALKAQRIYEDPYCFNCKGTVNVRTELP